MYENNFDIPLSAAGDHLTRIPFFGEWLKKRGAFVVKRKPCREDIKLFFNYLDNLITEEKKDILFFPGFTDRTGRSWNGNHQKFLTAPIKAVASAYENGINIYIIPCNISYNPNVPEEKILSIRYNHHYPLIGIVDLFYTFLPKRQIASCINLGDPHLFSYYAKNHSDKDFSSLSKGEKNNIIKKITSDVEKESIRLYKITPIDLLSYSIKQFDTSKCSVSDIMKCSENTYFELLEKKIDISLINLNELEDILYSNRDIFVISNSKVLIKNKFLLTYHNNRITSL